VMIIDVFSCVGALSFVLRRSFAPRLVINYHFLITQMMNPFSRFDSLPFFRGAILWRATMTARRRRRSEKMRKFHRIYQSGESPPALALVAFDEVTTLMRFYLTYLEKFRGVN
jgi:hypothetical protein